MNPRITIPVVVLVVTLASSSGLLRGGVVPQGPTLPVFSTGDQDGEISSCGCPREDYGGVTRKAAFLDTLRASGWEFVLLDAGDMTPFEGLTAQNRLKVETLARSMSVMGYHAIALGDRDLAPGPEFVAELLGWLGQPVLATNLHLPPGMPTEASRIVNVRGKRVGLLAYLDPSLASAAPWVTVDPWEASRKEVKALAQETDLLIAVAHAPDSAAVARLASVHPEIDLVIGAHQGMTASQLFQRGSTYVLGSSGRGRFLNRVEVEFDPAGKVSQMAGSFLPVVEAWGHRARVDSLLGDYHREMRKLVMSKEYVDEVTRSLMEPPVAFVGTEACASCHEAESAQWKTTLHSHAHETLVKAEKDHDPECQRCHTVGFGYRTGFVSPGSTPKLWNVGCESCHGGGAVHVAEPEKPYGDIIEDVCLGCHTSDNSPDFDYATYRPRIVHAP